MIFFFLFFMVMFNWVEVIHNIWNFSWANVGETTASWARASGNFQAAPATTKTTARKRCAASMSREHFRHRFIPIATLQIIFHIIYQHILSISIFKNKKIKKLKWYWRNPIRPVARASIILFFFSNKKK